MTITPATNKLANGRAAAPTTSATTRKTSARRLAGAFSSTGISELITITKRKMAAASRADVV